MPRDKEITEKMKFSEEDLNDPVIRAKLENFIKASIEILDQINTYRESYKDLKDDYCDQIGAPKRLLNKIAKYAYLKKKEQDKLQQEKENINLIENILDMIQNKD